jgi:hypothetical protein
MRVPSRTSPVPLASQSDHRSFIDSLDLPKAQHRPEITFQGMQKNGGQRRETPSCMSLKCA